MALIKLGGGVIDIRGSMAGNTFSRNRFGAYVRARTKPVNPNTSRQQAVRNRMQALTTAWNQSLSDAQRTAWAQYAAAIPWLNALGEEQYLTGFNMFVRSNAAILQAGLTQVNAGPTTLSLPETDPTFAVVGDTAADEVDITFDNTMDWANEDGGAMIISVGQPVNQTRNFFAGPYRYAGVIEGDSVTPPTTGASISSPFSLDADNRIFVRARIVRADGRLSQFFRDTVDLT